MRKQGMTAEEWISTPSRRLFNQLVSGGKVLGDKDEGRERSILWDACRGFHPSRTGMFTCWEQKVNARPGNHGARIDYILCSVAMRDWVRDCNIQEGLMVTCFSLRFLDTTNGPKGSDHCPVYATFHDRILTDQGEINFLDYMNPAGMFINGQRQRDYSSRDILPLSGRLIPEFDGRRSIRDMFSQKPSTRGSIGSVSSDSAAAEAIINAKSRVSIEEKNSDPSATFVANDTTPPSSVNGSVNATSRKRCSTESSTNRSLKRSKSGSTAATPNVAGKGQQSLKGFFKPKTATDQDNMASQPGWNNESMSVGSREASSLPSLQQAVEVQEQESPVKSPDRSFNGFITPSENRTSKARSPQSTPSAAPMSKPSREPPIYSQSQVHDPVASAESWSKLFTKPAAPRCEGHNEPCITLLTKKNGINCGRSFWMCPRPLGPSGAKEKNTQWRCQTFIWCSDWNPATFQSI